MITFEGRQESLRINRRKFGLQRAALCAVLATTGLLACTGDDSTPEDAGPAEMDASTRGDSAGRTSIDSSTEHDAKPAADSASAMDSSEATDSASTADSPSAPDSASFADAASATDAAFSDTSSANDAAADAVSLDGSDATADAAAGPTPVQLCTLWDTDFHLNEADASADGALYARTQWWGYSIVTNFANEAGNDCLVSDMFGDLADSTAYLNALVTFTIQFMGCSLPNDAGALAYAITNDPGLAGHIFSTADVNQLSADFVAGITDTLSCGGPCPPNDGTLPNDMNFPPMPALTAGSLSAIKARIDSLGLSAPNTGVGSTYTYDSCPVDAGADAPSDGG